MFSVIIPVYNCEKTIKKVLDSVLNQTRFDLVEDIIIVNDGSTDMSDCIIKQYITVIKIFVSNIRHKGIAVFPVQETVGFVWRRLNG